MTIKNSEEIKEKELKDFCGSGDDSKKSEYSFWYRVATTSSKSAVIDELRKIRKLEISNNLLSTDYDYFEGLKKAARAEFRSVDKRIEAEKIIGKRRSAEKAARDHRLILLGVCLSKLISEDSNLKTRVAEYLNMTLNRDVDRNVFTDLLTAANSKINGDNLSSNHLVPQLEEV